MTGTTASSATLRRVSHRLRPVYASANASQLTGTAVIPAYSTFAQKTLTSSPGLATSRA
ncbi:MAG TPA: hypothetical protein VK869_02735 [Rubrobacteraceae bacterium]|nr:hypothetical protein [Rubrobacteraceae bacterium]